MCFCRNQPIDENVTSPAHSQRSTEGNQSTLRKHEALGIIKSLLTCSCTKPWASSFCPLYILLCCIFPYSASVVGGELLLCGCVSFFVFFSHTISTFQLLDKPWSQVSSLLPPGSCLQFLSRTGFSNPTARRFFIECC